MTDIPLFAWDKAICIHAVQDPDIPFRKFSLDVKRYSFPFGCGFAVLW